MHHLYVGTSNVVVPGNKLTFPEEYKNKSRLHYYSTFFNSVEVNSSFYKTPMPGTYLKWESDVPADFRFTLKFSKTVTHSKSLLYDAEDITRFISSAKGVSMKKGCLLIQFPGKITQDYFTKVEGILNQVRAEDENGEWKTAVEFRHPSWHIRETVELLDEYLVTMVLQDFPKARNPDYQGKSSFVYMRFHGPGGDYRGEYSLDHLQARATDIRAWIQEGKEVYAYFNNTIGAAFQNALMLRKLVEEKE